MPQSKIKFKEFMDLTISMAYKIDSESLAHDEALLKTVYSKIKDQEDLKQVAYLQRLIEMHHKIKNTK